MTRPGFFKFYLPESSKTQMLIPLPFITCIGGVLPERVFLRDRYNNMWQVKVVNIGENWYFRKGWPKFVRDNSLKSCDFIVFDYFDEDLFDFKILGPDECETAGAGGFLLNGNLGDDEDFDDMVKDEEEKDDDGDNEVDYDGDQSDDNLFIKQEPRSEGEEDYDHEDNYRLFVELEPLSKPHDHDGGENKSYGNNAFVKNEPQSQVGDGYDDENYDKVLVRHLPQFDGDDYDDDDDDYTESDGNVYVKKEPNSEANHDDEDDDEEETEDADYMLNKENDHEEYASKPAIDAKSSRTSGRNQVSLYPRYCGMEIFDSGLAPRPKNPYFVVKLSPKRKGDLFIPAELIKDYNLKLPKPEMLIVDPYGRVFRGKYKKWKDGRILYSRGWRRLWKVNYIGENDIRICEFKRGQDGLYLKVDIIYANGRKP